MTSRSLLQSLADELALVLDPVALAVQSPEAMQRLLERLGLYDYSATGPVTPFAALLDLKAQIEALAAQDDVDLADAQAALRAAGSAFTLADAIADAGSAGGAMQDLGRDLVDLLLETWLARGHPIAREVLALLTLLEVGPDRPQRPAVVTDGIAPRVPIFVDRLRLDRLPALLRDPVAALKSHYVNALATQEDAAAMADRLFPQVAQVLRALGVSCRYSFKPGDEPLLGDAAPLMRNALIVYALDPLRATGFESDQPEAGVVLALSPASQGDLGLVVSPFGALTFKKGFDRWVFESTVSGQVDAVAWGRHGLTLLAQASDAQVQVDLTARAVPQGIGPAYVFGAADGTRLELGGVQLSAGTRLSVARQSLALSADVQGAALIIAPADGDGFLGSALPSQGLRAQADLGLAWSSDTGLTLRGSTGLDATLPIGLSIGGVTLSTVSLSLQPRDASVLAEVSASFAASIGPVLAVVERVGIATAITFPESGGNLGVANLDIGFKPPTGVGLSIDEAVVTGGGFLRFDPEKEQYAGIVELNLEGGIAVKGMGLIATRLPNNVKGYSLLIIITAEDFKPIPLPLGFRLVGIGGLLAVNRTFDENVLRAGLKNHTLDSVLFPQDPIRNAPQILSNLNSVFPPANGHHLFGPMAQIAWGTPTLITADLAVVLELGARQRLLILAQILAILPKPENDLIRLQMDGVGVVDFDQGTAALDATLYDSRLLKKFVLTGDMAMRLKWEGSRNFALAVGGLHPAFTPPPNFPKLERITLNLSAGNNPRLRAESYFALTPNTVQFGARAELYAEAAGFSIQGEVGFDVLIQPAPFHFLADFLAQVQLKRGSTNLFKVKVEGALAGPRPLHIKAKATFEVLWWDVSIRIDKTLVEGELPPPPTPIDVLPLLKEALSNPASWVSQLPAGQRPMVTLRGKPGKQTDALLHPLGILTVKQGVVPLDMDISRFGHATPAGARRFTISSVSLGDQRPTTEPVRDFFAPAQFFEMSDDEKLSRPSFDQMTAGVSIGSSQFVFPENPGDFLTVDAIEFETMIVEKGKKESRPSHPEVQDNLYTLRTELLLKQARFGAAANSDLRRTGRAKYRTTMKGKYQVEKEGWIIVATDDLTVQLLPGIEADRPASYSEAAQALQELKQTDPAKASRLKILRLSEV